MKNPKPLSDLRVLAIESYGAGPWATLQLADLGAEVIKIESPRGGDVSRYVPPGAKEGDSLPNDGGRPSESVDRLGL
jgi:crotonobetainyl-CoA:carnitine CoA-transferase CaiB-like acyl-CoA transferase